VGSSATFGAASSMNGTVLANRSITLNAGARLNGRALARDAAVTLASSVITRPDISEDGVHAQNPGGLELYQNYPNPFNPSTSIEYTIEHAAFVSLKIYNLLGIEVATLVSSHQEAGTYAVPFNSSSTSLHLSSGIYFYRLEAGPIVSMKRLALIK
jgi:hypothetical protein